MKRMILIACFALLLSGCTATGVEDFNAQVEELRQQSLELDRIIDEGKVIAESLPPGSQRDGVLEGIASAEKHKAVVDGAIDDYLSRIDALSQDANVWDSLGAGAGTASTILPPPFNVYAILGSLGFGAIAEVRRHRLKKTAGKVVTAIEDAKDEAGSVNFGDPIVEAKLRSKMGSDGQSLVRELK